MQQDGRSAAATRPVFVDASGRRGRWIRRLFWGLGVLMAAYVAVVFVALVGAPSLSRLAVPGLGPVLPGSGAPGLRTATGTHSKPSTVFAPRPTPSPRADGPAAGGATGSPVPRLTAAAASPTAGPAHPTARPTPPSTVGASTRPTGPAASPGPRSSQTPPGQASGHPTPRSSHAKGASPQPSPTP